MCRVARVRVVNLLAILRLGWVIGVQRLLFVGRVGSTTQSALVGDELEDEAEVGTHPLALFLDE